MTSSGGDVHNVYNENTGSGSVVQARDIGTVNFYGQPPAGGPEEDPWVRLVAESAVWGRVTSSRSPDRVRESAVQVVRGLTALRDAAVVTDDPWQDLDLARRFSERVDWLVTHDKITVDLNPAEAALLALTPLLHHCLWLRAAAKYRAVGPTDFTPALDPDDLRESFEGYLRNHDKLVVRASLPALPNRTSAHDEIGWWLFHRWLRQRAELLQLAEVDALLAEVAQPDLRQVLTTKRVRDLLYGLRVDSRWLTDERRVSAPDAVETVFGGTSEDQPLRKHLVALLLGAAHTAAIEVTDLSDVLVWHMGIPNPVEVDALFTTVREASWHKRDDGPVLSASCDHEAVVEALQAHASRLGDLLRDVRLVTRFRGLEPLGGFPSRATGDLVKPREDDHGNPRFSGWSKFRVDEERVRDLLMGEQLYQDRRMAIRELYQNALDACRYRQARETYGERRGRPSTWTGEIKFVQGVDDDGRHYLDCVDNGIGMDIPELTGVFAQAGVRFAQLPEFQEEQFEWRGVDPPVELHPNSRFGIGVLSYFMLADEIEVTTCRASRDGGLTGPNLRVTISGPGQLFQIRKTADHGQPGTTVRLYFREPDPQGEVVRWLEEVLVIADFSTTSEHSGRTHRWEPGVVTHRPDRVGELDFGRLLPAGSVLWCAKNGALLVDGLVVAPSTWRGVLDDQSSSVKGPRGFVVNLTGPMAPRLSVDRTRVLDDVADQVELLLVSALPRLVSHGKPLVNATWLTDVADRSIRLADLVVRALIENRFVLTAPDHEVDLATSGWLSLDSYFTESARKRRAIPGAAFEPAHGSPADHVLLWRLLAHAPNSRLAALEEADPDTTFPAVDLPALPSDAYLLLVGRQRWRVAGDRMNVGDILQAAVKSGVPPRDVARRAQDLGFSDLRPDLFPEGPAILSDLPAFDEDGSGEPSLLRHDRPVPARHFLRARKLGRSVKDMAGILARYGFDVTEAETADGDVEWPKNLWFPSFPARWRPTTRLTDDNQELLAETTVTGDGPMAPIGYLLKMSRQWRVSLEEVIDRIAVHGVTTTTTSPPLVDTVDFLLLSKTLTGRGQWLPPDEPVSATHVVNAFVELGVPIPRCVERLTAYGHHVAGDFRRDTVDQADLQMLKAGGFGLDNRRHHRAITLDRLLTMGEVSDRSLEEVVDHLRGLGLHVPDVVCSLRSAIAELPRRSQTLP